MIMTTNTIWERVGEQTEVRDWQERIVGEISGQFLVRGESAVILIGYLNH